MSFLENIIFCILGKNSVKQHKGQGFGDYTCKGCAANENQS